MKHSSIKSQWTMNDLINKRSKVTDQLQMSMGPWCFLLVCGSIWSIWEISFSAQNVLKITWHSELCCPKPFPGNLRSWYWWPLVAESPWPWICRWGSSALHKSVWNRQSWCFWRHVDQTLWPQCHRIGGISCSQMSGRQCVTLWRRCFRTCLYQIFQSMPSSPVCTSIMLKILGHQ